MIIEVGIELVNIRDMEVVVDVPIGTVFEVDNLSYQNVATSQPYRFVLPARSRLTTQVKGVCLNRNASEPTMTQGRLTPFRFSGSSMDQQAVWDAVSNPMGA